MEFQNESIRKIVAVLLTRSDVTALTLFGSHARQTDIGSADNNSDVDLQVIARDPGRLLAADWVRETIGPENLEAWNVREAFGGVKKISVLLLDGELDLVIIPHGRMRRARWAVAMGWHHRSDSIRRKLGNLVMVVGDGYQVLKGGAKWERFWQRLVVEVVEPRIDPEGVENLWASAQVDHRSIMRKLARGELLAAQRWLHTGMVETNFQLMHALKRRRGELSFHDARRAEMTLEATEVDLIRVSAHLTESEIRRAADEALKSSQSMVEKLREAEAG